MTGASAFWTVRGNGRSGLRDVAERIAAVVGCLREDGIERRAGASSDRFFIHREH